MNAAAAIVASDLAPEEQARAGLYALLARLWRAPPDAALLAGLARQAGDVRAAPADATAGAGEHVCADDQADALADAGAHADGDTGTGGAALDRAWAALCVAAATARPQAVADEYAAAFGGVGRPEVFLHGSYYLAGFLHERPLARLRDHLAALGLSRRTDRSDTEDHLALLCETMRYLVRSSDPTLSAPGVQRDFFRAHLSGWIDAFVDAVLASAATDFYRHVARLTRAFVEVERTAFEID